VSAALHRRAARPDPVADRAVARGRTAPMIESLPQSWPTRIAEGDPLCFPMVRHWAGG